ncbi:MAG: DUF1028 domain-containing protein [Thermoplasmataceae archaeon]
MTFSVVSYDPEERKWGVGVSSRYLSVGSIVPWAKAGVGCIATQSYANYTYGPEGLELLRKRSAEDAGKALTDADNGREKRQLGIVDAGGNAWAFTGKECHEYAGHIVGKNFSVQGNILAGPEVLESMAEEMEKPGKLEDRIMKSLFAAESRGGDRRGKQSAAILVVSEVSGFTDGTDRYIDLRVEDSRNPLRELNRLMGLWKATFLDRNTVDLSIHQQEIDSRIRHLGYIKLQDWLRDNGLENSVENGKIGLAAMRILMGNDNPELP